MTVILAMHVVIVVTVSIVIVVTFAVQRVIMAVMATVMAVVMAVPCSVGSVVSSLVWLPMGGRMSRVVGWGMVVSRAEGSCAVWIHGRTSPAELAAPLGRARHRRRGAISGAPQVVMSLAGGGGGRRRGGR